MTVESETNILYLNINFAGNLFSGFGRHCGKVVPELVVPHTFWAPAITKNVLSIFFFHVDTLGMTVGTNGCPLFCYDSSVLKQLFFYIFFIKMSCFGSCFFF